LYFTGFLSPYPWVARCRGVAKVFFTDQGSQPEGYVATRRPAWKRLVARALNLPLNQVICISDYNVNGMLRRDLIDARRVMRIYNSVDLAAAHGDGAAFRLRHTPRPRGGGARDPGMNPRYPLRRVGRGEVPGGERGNGSRPGDETGFPRDRP